MAIDLSQKKLQIENLDGKDFYERYGFMSCGG